MTLREKQREYTGWTTAAEEEFELLYYRYRGLMVRVAERILKNNVDAEDALSQAFIAIYEKFSRISNIDSPETKAFVIAIVKRKAHDIIRKNKIVIVPYNEETITQPVYDEEELGVVKALDRLTASYRNVIVWKYVMGYTTEEISHMLEKSHGAVTKLIWRAKEALREELSAEGIEL